MKCGDLVSFCLDGRRNLRCSHMVIGMILETCGDGAHPVGPPYDDDILFEDRYLVWWFNSANRVKKLNMHPIHLEPLNETR